MNEVIHTYLEPPQNGATALCGHVRESDMEGYRLIRSDNLCPECERLAEEQGLTIIVRLPLDDDRVWRLDR